MATSTRIASLDSVIVAVVAPTAVVTIFPVVAPAPVIAVVPVVTTLADEQVQRTE